MNLPPSSENAQAIASWKHNVQDNCIIRCGGGSHQTFIPVMAHIGLTPQSVYGLGGYKVQGRGEAAQRMFDQATNLEKAGAFAIVLEAMPADLGAEITTGLHIPTIGIGAGAGTDAQVLVVHDLLGINETTPKLAKKYADLRQVMTEAVSSFVHDVETGTFPDDEHSYS